MRPDRSSRWLLDGWRGQGARLHGLRGPGLGLDGDLQFEALKNGQSLQESRNPNARKCIKMTLDEPQKS